MGFFVRTDSPEIFSSGGIRWVTTPHWMMQFDDAAFALSAVVQTDRVDDLRARNPWEVGFIQNVLRQDIDVRYQSGVRVQESKVTPALDCWGENAPWMHPVQTRSDGVTAWLGVLAQGPDKALAVRLNTEDMPSAAYYNFRNGGTGHRGDPIVSIRDRVTFRTWLAALPAGGARDDIAAYDLLQATAPFVLERAISVAAGSGNAVFQSAFDAVYAGQMNAAPTLHADVHMGIDGTIEWFAIGTRAGDRQPVVSGIAANAAYGQWFDGLGIGPRVWPEMAPTRRFRF